MKSSLVAVPPQVSSYRWFVLALAALTFTLVMGMPNMSLPVLFPEIAADLQLTIVQVGVVWGVGSLTGIVMGLLGGLIGDRIGAQRTLLIFCAFIGVAGAARGLASGFSTLVFTVFLLGVATPVVPTNIHKICGIWFPGRQLGMANGVVSTGMALGFMLGSLLSATVLSPWLGGWRNVLFFYGVVALLFSLFWAFTKSAPDETDGPRQQHRPPVRQGLVHVMQLRNVWLLGLTLFGVSGAIQGTLGYLPSYLRAVGWEPATADSALASFHGMSMLLAIPLAMLSDRLGKRRQLLIVGIVLITIGFAMLIVVTGPLVWLAVILAGMTRDGFMAIFMTKVLETEGVGTTYAGTATGLTLGCAMLGSVLAPPLGNSLESIALNVPFALWSGMLLLGLVALFFVQE
ncbi:MAG TPA: MFS transporter [Caldilineaceae bacterium]|nr:MFS transporter [Caldilineaceae bacterium]